MNTGDGGKLGPSDGMMGYGTILFRIFDDNRNEMIYCNVLRYDLKQSMSLVPNKNKLIFQQELAQLHTSNIVQETIKTLKFKVLDWTQRVQISIQ